MTVKRTDYNQEDGTGPRSKRAKVESNGSGGDNGGDMESNPYLAHWNDGAKSRHPFLCVRTW
jgi:hypothetical protein